MRRITKRIKTWTTAFGLAVALLGSGCTAESEESPTQAPDAAPEAAQEAETPVEESAQSGEAAETAETVVAQATPAPEATANDNVTDGGTDDGSVWGTVKFDGPRPKRKTLKLSADAACVAAHDGKAVGSENELVSPEGDVANVFVYVKDGANLGADAPIGPARLVQNGCMYSPRVVGVQVGQPFEVENTDPFMHNVRGLAKKNRPFNFGQPNVGVRERVFKRVEMPIKVRCDVHPWMAAFIFVTDHPFYAVTDRAGAFSIPGLPAGQHTVVAVHEKYGEKELQVTVPAGGGADGADFTYTPADIKSAW